MVGPPFWVDGELRAASSGRSNWSSGYTRCGGPIGGRSARVTGPQTDFWPSNIHWKAEIGLGLGSDGEVVRPGPFSGRRRLRARTLRSPVLRDQSTDHSNPSLASGPALV